MTEQFQATPAPKVEAAVLDPEDGEAGIVEVYSGRVLARFPSLRSAAQTLRHQRAWYEEMAHAIRRTLADRIAACATLYRQGYTRAQISAEIGRCEAVVGRYLDRAGVKMRPGGGRRLDYEEASRMLAAGVTRAEVARRLHTSRSAITGAINRGTLRAPEL